MSQPALPPRRNVPPPPPPRRVSSQAEADEVPQRTEQEYESEPPRGIAARIASLQLDQVGRNPLANGSGILKPRRAVPLPPPDSAANDYEEQTEEQNVPTLPSRKAVSKVSPGVPDIQRLLARKPPPPPIKEDYSSKPPIAANGGRRLPPMPTRLPTPPPEPEPEPEAELEYQENAPLEYSCLKCHDFSFVDEHAAQFPRHTVASLDQLALDLTSPWGSETEKFRAIFTWLHHNISYDAVSFLSGNIRPATAESTLQSGLAVCDGYAGLFKYLADRAGLQAHRVSGHGKGYGYVAAGQNAPLPPFQGNHAWNCVLMDGQWHLIDSCWGAGHLEGSTYTPRFSPGWFTSTPAEFGERHFPEDPSYQLLETPISWADYILVPEGPAIFGEFYQHSFAPQLLEPNIKHLQSGSWVLFRLFKLCEHMSTAEDDNWVYFINTPDDNRIPMEPDHENGGWSANVYLPRGRGDVSLYFVRTFDGEDAEGLPIQLFKNSIGRKAMSFGGLARWEAV